MIRTTYTASDGIQFNDRAAAENHQALVTKIEVWLERGPGDTARHTRRELLLAWTSHHENTHTGVTEHGKPE